MRPTSRPPLWFVILVAVAAAAALRVLAHAYGAGDAAPGDAPPVSLAFFGFFIGLIGAIWQGVQVAAKVTLIALKWAVVNLSWVVTKLGNGFKALGASLLQGLKRAWDFTRRLYDDVLKPAWQHFWKWFDKFRRWLDQTFGPVLEWLREVRDNLLGFYRQYVRPWLDLIDVTRRIVRVLAALHIPFARELDRRLGRLEELIERPFRLALAKINEVINIVNRVVTLDGLIQRVALIRSLARDFEFAWRAMVNPKAKALSQEKRDELKKAMAGKSLALVQRDLRQLFATGGGADAPIVSESAAQWRLYLRGQAPPDVR